MSISSRHLRRICRTSTSSLAAVQLPYRHYSTSTVCQACQTKLTAPLRTNVPSRRLLSQAATLSSNSNIEEPLKPTKTPQTHYEFFPQTLSSGPPPSGSFVIDTRELRKDFLQLQAVAHPDRHPQKLKQRAEATSARINEAYKTLQNPLSRAQYLLSLRGIDVAEDETAKVEDPQLLMEVLDTREQIESAKEEGKIEELRAINDERVESSEEVLEEAFKEDDIEKAKEEAVRLRYWINIKESLDAWERGKPVVLMH